MCVVFSVDSDSSLDRVSSHWIPTIQRAREEAGKNVGSPIILVGNKVRCGAGLHCAVCCVLCSAQVDLAQIDTRKNESDLEKLLTPIMKKYREVETCVEVRWLVTM